VTKIRNFFAPARPVSCANAACFPPRKWLLGVLSTPIQFILSSLQLILSTVQLILSTLEKCETSRFSAPFGQDRDGIDALLQCRTANIAWP